MIEKYFSYDGVGPTDEQWKRLIAVQAALEIAKESAGAPTAYDRSNKVENDLDFAAKNIEALADAIQTALDKE